MVVLCRFREYIGDEPFLVTYGDGVADVDINAVVALHKKQGKKATVTAVRPPARFGEIYFDNQVRIEQSRALKKNHKLIAAGSMVVFLYWSHLLENYMTDETSIFEREPLIQLAQENELSSYLHHGFWQCMDTMRDVETLQKLWAQDEAPWRLWK